MSDDPQTNVSPPPQQPATAGFFCASCGHSIRGLAVDALCPQCGTPVAHSFGSRKPASGKAITSLVLGIVSILGCAGYGIPSVVCGPLAIIFWHLARKQIEAGEVSPGSAGMARAGLICGIIGCVLAAAGIFVFFVVMALAVKGGP